MLEQLADLGMDVAGASGLGGFTPRRRSNRRAMRSRAQLADRGGVAPAARRGEPRCVAPAAVARGRVGAVREQRAHLTQCNAMHCNVMEWNVVQRNVAGLGVSPTTYVM